MLIAILSILIYIAGFALLFFLFGKYNPNKLEEYIGGIVVWPIILVGIIMFIPLELAFAAGYVAYVYGKYLKEIPNISFGKYLKEEFKNF